ncbi:MAG: Ig-like domain-containing protein [Gemmatimonadaceae bacterium]
MRVRCLSPMSIGVLGLLACGGDGGGGTTNPATVVAVIIEANPATLRPGQTSLFTATGVDAQGNAVPGAGAVTWSSSAPSVATVDGNGTVRAVQEGTTAIQAVIKGINGARTISVLPAGASAVVSMPGFSFAPFTVTIKRTESVFFDFPALPHNVIFGQKTGAPDDIQQQSNVTVTRQFNTVGTFAYDCTIHPGMKGEVVVQ